MQNKLIKKCLVTVKRGVCPIIFGLCMLSLLLSAGCTRKIYVPVGNVSDHSVTDSTVISAASVDSVMGSDSVVIVVKGDTLIRDRVRTVAKVRLRVDTVTSVRVDTLRVSAPVMATASSSSDGSGTRLMALAVVLLVAAVSLWFVRKYFKSAL